MAKNVKAKKTTPISLDRLKVFGGDDSLTKLRCEFILDASYDHYLGDIVDKVIGMIGDKYPDGLPEDVRHIHTFDNGTIHAFTRVVKDVYLADVADVQCRYEMVLWRDEQFQAALKPVLAQVQQAGKKDEVPDINRDIVFDATRLTEWKIPEVVA